MFYSYIRLLPVVTVISALAFHSGAAFAADDVKALRQQLNELEQQMLRMQKTYEKQIEALEQRNWRWWPPSTAS